MLGEFFQGLRAIEPFTEKDPVDLLHTFHLFECEALTLQTHFVEGANDGWLTIGDEERSDVLHDFRVRADHRIGADAAELVHSSNPSDGDVILNPNVSRERDRIAHHDVVGQMAIVGHVAVGKDDVVVADDREFTVVGGSVNRDVFTEDIPCADFHTWTSSFELQILRFRSQASVGKNFAIRPEHGETFYGSVVLQASAIAERYARSNESKGPDFNVGPEFDTRFNNRGGVDARCHGD